jgi:hypothetical protein
MLPGSRRPIDTVASSLVVEIRDGRRRAAATATSLAEARRRDAGAAVIGVGG